jgi:hypothetical protein
MIRIREKVKNGSRFSELVAELVAAKREFAQLNTPSAGKLTPDAFAKRARKIAWPDLPDAQALAECVKLRDVLFSSHETSARSETLSSLRRMVAAYRSWNWAGPATELRRLNWAMSPEAIAELIGMKSGTFALSAVAALIAAEQHPGDFGTCEDLSQHQERLVSTRLRIDELQEQIKTAWVPDDLIIDPADKLPLAIKLGDGNVLLHPVGTLGERAANFLMAQNS